jgi:hypothetical protein
MNTICPHCGNNTLASKQAATLMRDGKLRHLLLGPQRFDEIRLQLPLPVLEGIPAHIATSVRYDSVKRGFMDGAVPPVVLMGLPVYRIQDGSHRIAAARELGLANVDAILRLPARNDEPAVLRDMARAAMERR